MRKIQYLLTASSDSKGPVERNTLKCDAYNREYIKYKFQAKQKAFFFGYTPSSIALPHLMKSGGVGCRHNVSLFCTSTLMSVS